MLLSGPRIPVRADVMAAAVGPGSGGPAGSAVPGMDTGHSLEMVISRLRKALRAPPVATVIERRCRLDP